MEPLSWQPAEHARSFTLASDNGDLKIANPAGVPHFHLSLSLILSSPPAPHAAVCGETAGIIQHSSAHPEGCDSEARHQVYLDIDKKLHTAAAEPQGADGAENSLPLPIAVCPRRKSRGWMASP